MRIVAILLASFLAAGCAAVAPWERGALARRDMQVSAEPGTGRVFEKTFAAKEAASGGSAVGGGGCGCN